MGSDTYLREITETVDIPVLRKDFTVDKYMIYQAKAFGASAGSFSAQQQRIPTLL